MMRKLAKYLKPFILGIFLTILLLFVQSIAELNLPNRMSDIVNIGLQQGGIEHAAPDAISPRAFEMMLAFMPEEDAAFLRVMYEPVTDDSGTVYLRRDSEAPFTNEGRAGMDEIFGEAAYSLLTMMQSAGPQSQQAQPAGTAAIDISSVEFDINAAYAFYDYIKSTGGAVTLTQTTEETAAVSHQAGAMLVRAFYEELGMDTVSIQSGYIWRSGLYMLLISLISVAAAISVGFMAPRVAAGAARNLRSDLFAKVESFSHHEFDKFSSASLITRCTNDVQQIQMLVGMSLRMLVSAPIMGIGGIIMAFNKAPSMSWIIALAVIVLLGLVVVVSTIALPRFKIIQKLVDNLNKVSRETLNGLMVIRAFGTQKHEIKRFDDANKELTDVNLFVGRLMAVVGPLITFIMSGASLLIIWVGARHISESGMQIGDMLAFMQYAIQVVMSFMMLSMMTIMIPRAAVSGERIAEVLMSECSINDPARPKNLDPSKKGLVEFKNVSFRYDNAEDAALSNINFTAKPGQTTAIIGATGSGKTTIANLLLRFYDVTEGSVNIDGVDVRELSQHDLREVIGYVPQKGQLLAGTVASNIRYGRPDASDGDVAEAAEVAQASGFINEKDEKYEADISQGGTNVSGGQKQRLSIARALAKKPEILVFDDSFSALDFQTDAKLRRALKKHAANATVIVVAQRVGTIMHAEQILVIDAGKIIGRGTHGELLKSCPAYREIAQSQLEAIEDEPAYVSSLTAIGKGAEANA